MLFINCSSNYLSHDTEHDNWWLSLTWTFCNYPGLQKHPQINALLRFYRQKGKSSRHHWINVYLWFLAEKTRVMQKQHMGSSRDKNQVQEYWGEGEKCFVVSAKEDTFSNAQQKASWIGLCIWTMLIF